MILENKKTKLKGYFNIFHVYKKFSVCWFYSGEYRLFLLLTKDKREKQIKE